MDKVTPTQTEIGDYTVTPADRELVEAIIGHRQYRDIPHQLAARHAEQARREQIERDAAIAESMFRDAGMDGAFGRTADAIAQAIRGQTNGTD